MSFLPTIRFSEHSKCHIVVFRSFRKLEVLVAPKWLRYRFVYVWLTPLWELQQPLQEGNFPKNCDVLTASPPLCVARWNHSLSNGTPKTGPPMGVDTSLLKLIVLGKLSSTSLYRDIISLASSLFHSYNSNAERCISSLTVLFWKSPFEVRTKIICSETHFFNFHKQKSLIAASKFLLYLWATIRAQWFYCPCFWRAITVYFRLVENHLA